MEARRPDTEVGFGKNARAIPAQTPVFPPPRTSGVVRRRAGRGGLAEEEGSRLHSAWRRPQPGRRAEAREAPQGSMRHLWRTQRLEANRVNRVHVSSTATSGLGLERQALLAEEPKPPKISGWEKGESAGVNLGGA